MERDKALKIVEKQLTEHRYVHTIGVMETATYLAEKYNENVEKAELSAIFHDYAKFRSKEEMKQIISEQKFSPLLLEYNSELWHAPVGAFLVEKEVGIKDHAILDAIKFHTSGRPYMSLLEKIIYVADYIEPGRHFPGVDEVRELAEINIDKALIKSLQNTIMFLLKKNQAVYPDTIQTYNWLVLEGGRTI
ncbi:bis(5'-nucleosyl)-tetraphosphatase (symmetrical) YqeK [Metabacillus litoralis]|uniref:bis(5'-nucleosyl)-tetraphosphatase (symmetrical) YqeK n=1 Tax=Metabacillus litoralis TaxID=152268 RepID=UPI001CFC7663|nr:bis(5'-nucleosyl)-tetraphosphatase (symmetrical) YqeK [Metabacillus litoralis]